MKNNVTGILFSFLIIGNVFSAFSPIEYQLRPDYTLVNLRPSGFAPKVSDLAWLSDGRLVVVHWADHKQPEIRIFEGRIYLLDGVQTANGPQDVTVNLFKSNIEDPTGVWVLNDTIYTSGGYYLMAHIDSDNDGTADAADTLFNWNYADKCRHEFFHGLVYQNGYFYTNTSRCKDDPDRPSGAYANTWQQHTGRGGFYRISKATGQATLIAGGLRSPYGMGLGPLGDIFQSDNQGSWLPSSKLIHPKQGRFYGYYADNYTLAQDYGPSFANASESPPAVWLPHGLISHSPGHPLLVDQGIYVGQMLVGDVAYGGIQRIFLEMVNGEWQGSAFNWTGGLEAGPGSLLWGPDGSLYVGGIGIGENNNWGWRGTTSGLQKLVPVPNAPVVFEMLEVRSRADGMEILFTKPVNSAASNAANYTIVRSEQTPIRPYGGGNGMNPASVTVTAATLSSDNRSVHLALNMNQLRGGAQLVPNSVLDITLGSAIRSQAGDNLWVNRTWYTLNAISPSTAFDVNGCTNSSYAEYNPQATFDDGTCRTALTSVRTVPKLVEGVRKINGGIAVSLLDDGPHSIQVTALNGRLVEKKSGQGRRLYTFNLSQQGLYIVRIQVNGSVITQKVSNF